MTEHLRLILGALGLLALTVAVVYLAVTSTTPCRRRTGNRGKGDAIEAAEACPIFPGPARRLIEDFVAEARARDSA